MTCRPRISILIPAYNSERFLAEAIQSALDQSIPPLEVLVLDDGSEDGTARVARAFPEPVRYVRLPHRGVAAARNAGLEIFRGDYVVNLDADDRLDPQYLEKTHALLSAQTDPQIAYCYTQCRFFGAWNGVSNFPEFDPSLLPIRNFVLATALLRGDVARQFRFREEICFHEDYDFYMQLLAAGYRGVRLDEPLLLYRQHETNRTAQNKRWLHHIRIMEHFILSYPSLYTPEIAEQARKRAREKTFLGFIESRSAPASRGLRLKQFLWMARYYPRHAETWRHARAVLGKA